MNTKEPAANGRVFSLSLLALLLIATLWSGRPASAAEALGDLDLQIRLVGVDQGKGIGHDMQGSAKIEAVLTVAQTTERIRLTVEKADGSPWMVGSHPFDPEPVKWRKLDGGEPYEATDGTPRVGARGALRTTLVVPLKGADIHEIVLRVTGTGQGGTLTTEAMLKAPLGVEEELPVEQDGVATFKMKEGKR